MKKTILIPTDFSIESLMPVKQAALTNHDSQIEIILMYCCFSTNSITDLLFYSPDNIIEQDVSFEFKEACQILENTYRSRIKLSIEVFHGHNNSAFENFVAGKQITEAIILNNYTYKLTKNTFNPVPYIKKSGLTYQEVSLPEDKNLHKDILLFNLFIS
jgi:hypothetical protein